MIGRLLRGGIPAILSQGLNLLIPLMGIFFLPIEEYSFWVLAATLSSMFIAIDFGAGSLAAKLASEGRLDSRTLAKCFGVTSMPSLILGAIALLAWPPYADAAHIQVPESTALGSIGLIAVGSALRSVGAVSAGVALGRAHFTARGVILGLGAVINAGTVAILLFFNPTLYALGAGLIASGIFQASVGLFAERPDPVRAEDVSDETHHLVRTFMISKSITGVCAIAVTQLDRWAVALVASPSILGAYDLAARVSMIPRVAISTLAVGLIPEAARILGTGPSGRRLFYWRSVKITGALSVAGGLFAFLTIIAGCLILFEVSRPEVFLLALILASTCTAVSMTSTPVMLTSGWGLPWIELIYLLPLTFCVGVIYVIGVLVNGTWFMLSAWALANVLLSVVFVFRAHPIAESRLYRASILVGI